MSQFKEYTLHLLDGYFVEGISLTSKNTVGVIEIAALEAAQKEIESIRTQLLAQCKMSKELLDEKAKLSAALKVAEGALGYMTEDFDCDAEDVALYDMLKAKAALAEIQKIKEELEEK